MITTIQHWRRKDYVTEELLGNQANYSLPYLTASGQLASSSNLTLDGCQDTIEASSVGLIEAHNGDNTID